MSRSYTSTAFSEAVATGYSCRSSNELCGSVSSNVDGTTSGSSPFNNRDKGHKSSKFPPEQNIVTFGECYRVLS